MRRILAFIGAITIIIFVFWAIERDVEKIGDWPEDLDKDKMCNLENYLTCNEYQWFGIWRSSLPVMVKSNDEFAGYSSVILNEICIEFSETPKSRLVRIITIDEEEAVYLCRMKDPQKINRGKILEEVEHTRFKLNRPSG